MGYELIITEKPSSAMKIAAALADGKPVKKANNKVPYWELSHDKKDIVVASAVGHLFGVGEKEKSFKYPSFDIEWKPSSETNKGAAFTKKYATTIKKLAKDAETITIATDYDIEGETIGLNVVRYLCKKDDANRMMFSTVTAEDLREAYKEKRPTLDWGQANAGETRHFLDWIYGINISRALTSAVKTTGSFLLLSSGRVQGPALKIVVEKEKEIKAFIPEDFWQLELQAKKEHEGKSVPYSAWHKDNKIFDEEKAKTIYETCKGKEAKVKKVDRREFKQPAPIPFDLGGLQTEAFRLFKIRPKETLEHAQTLYSGGFISYPRTSSQQLPAKVGYEKILKGLQKQDLYRESASQLLEKGGPGAKGLKPNNGKKKDLAHPAIFPTGYVPNKMKEREKKVYDLIVKRFFATFGDPAVRESMTVTIDCADEEFLAKGARTLEQNWHFLYSPYVNLKEDPLPPLSEGEAVDITGLKKHKKQTQPPKRYTQASIITELEKRGLGTKATRADIVENLYKRGYVEGTSITATDLGIKTVEALEKYMPRIVDEELTRHFEEELEEIRKKTKEPKQILDEAKARLTQVLDEFRKQEKEVGKELLASHREYQDEKNTLGPCPTCKKGVLMIKFSRKNKSRFVGCDGYPDCTQTYPLPKSGMVTAAGKQCEHCGVPMVSLKMARRGAQELCINPECPSRQKGLKEAQVAEEAENGGEERPCPKCKEGTLKLRNGIYGAFYGCSTYPKCRYTENVKKNSDDEKKEKE